MLRWFVLVLLAVPSVCAAEPLRVGVAEVDITPPVGFPMAGYYHERLATGSKDPLKAKAVVFVGDKAQAAWVVCDLTGIATDLSQAVRQQAAKVTGIPVEHIIVSATHSHTAPDYTKALYEHLGKAPATPRTEYAGRLIDGIAQAIIKAKEAAAPVTLHAGSAEQKTPVSFCRRSVMRDGSVQTWVGLKHPQAVRLAAPIDPEIGLVRIDSVDGKPLGVLSNFALHLDTVGGLEWAGDYPYYIEQTLRQALKSDVISLFGTGTCGDINHVDPTGQPRLKTDFIGNSLGETAAQSLAKLTAIEQPTLQVRRAVVPLPLQDVSPAEVQHAVQIVAAIQKGEKIAFLDHVTAYKHLVLDQFRHREPNPQAAPFLSWGLSHACKNIGETLPVEVQVITVGTDLAIVTLPGEVFVELGLAIKRASPFRTTFVVELANAVETIYIPTRSAAVGGGYEVTNSLVQPGSGELLVEAAIGLLRESATALEAANP